MICDTFFNISTASELKLCTWETGVLFETVNFGFSFLDTFGAFCCSSLDEIKTFYSSSFGKVLIFCSSELKLKFHLLLEMK